MVRLVKMLIWLLCLSPAMAAELKQTNNGICDYTLSGDISEGDAESVRAINGSYDPIKLCMNSRGGSMDEALKLFHVIWDGNTDTVLLPGDECKSACAIAFMGGSNVQGTDLTRQITRGLYPGSKLGFHSPSLALAPGTTQPTAAVLASYRSALNAAARLFEISQIKEKGGIAISDFLYGMILHTPPSGMYELATVGDLVLAGVQPLGLKIEYPKGDKFFKNVCRNFYVSNPPEGSYFTLLYNAAEHYAEVLSPGSQSRDSEPNDEPGLVDWSRQTLKTYNKDGYRYAWVGPYFSGTKYSLVYCLAKMVGKSSFEELKASDEYDDWAFLSAALVYVPNSSLEASPFDIVKEEEIQAVPFWYTYKHDTKIDDLPTDPDEIKRLRLPDVLGKEPTGVLSNDLSRRFRTFVGYDLKGEDLRNLKDIRSPEECVQHCSQQDECIGATYDRWHKRCFLKRQSEALFFNTIADSFAVRPQVKYLKRATSDRKMTLSRDKGFTGSPIRSTATIEAKACSSECETLESCLAFQISDAGCELFDRPSSFVDRSGYQAGIYLQQ